MAAGDLDWAAYREILLAQDWEDLSVRLTRYSYYRGLREFWRYTWSDAQDVSQDVICTMFDPETSPRWDPNGPKKLLWFLCNRAANRVKSLRRKASRHAALRGTVAARFQAKEYSEAEAQALRGVAGRTIDLLRRRFLGDPDVLLVIASLEEGVDDIKDTAQKSGIGVKRARDARWRMAEALVEVEEQVVDEEQSRD